MEYEFSKILKQQQYKINSQVRVYYKNKLMEMENSIQQPCQHLLNRIRTSNIQPFFPKSRTKSDKDSRLESLSLQRRKLNQSITRRYSLTGGFNKITHQMLQKFTEKPSAHQENLSIRQPQFNLRKGSKVLSQIKPLRQPFTNLTNSNNNKFRLTLDGQKSLNKPSLLKKKVPLEQSLHVNGLVTSYQQDQDFVPISKQKNTTFTSSQKFHDGSDSAVENAGKVNQIYNFIKEKAHLEGQEIDQFTQIIFKLVCYFFVSLITQKGIKVNFDPRKMIDFIEKQIHQSYSALNSFKNSRKQGYSNQNLRSSQENVGQNSGGNFIRKSNRVSSFFKSVQNTGKQSTNDKEDSGLSSLRKFNQSRSNQDPNTNLQAKINLKIPQNNKNRKLSIVLNSVTEDSEQQSEIAESQRTLTDNSNTNTQTIENSNQDLIERFNQQLPRLSYRPSITKRKSCFLTEMNRKDLQKQISQGEVVHVNQSQSSHMKLNSLETSNNGSRSDLQSESQLKSVASYMGLSNPRIQINRRSSQLNSKQSIKSKGNLNLSTPYDFTKEDNLMTKRRKYLELHQQIAKMNQVIEELKKQQQQITERIEVKDGELINMENNLYDINHEIQMYKSRSKEADDFLNGNECPQMVQKIIKKNIQIKKNLTNLLNSHAWESSNLSQSSHAQHIYTTKQSIMDKLNGLTRKFRGCKSVQNIEGLVGEMRDIFLFSIERYSQIIEEFQDKLRQAEEERSNMLKNLEDWEIENKIKEKLLSNSFLDYYSVERKVTNYIEKLPESLKKLQQSVYALSHQRKADYVVELSSEGGSQSKRNDPKYSANNLQKSYSQSQSKKVLMMEKQIVAFLDKMLSENGVIFTELPKQKKFAMVLEKIV